MQYIACILHQCAVAPIVPMLLTRSFHLLRCPREKTSLHAPLAHRYNFLIDVRKIFPNIPQVKPKNPVSRTGGMDKADSSDESHAELEDRDPRNLNQHLQVIWEEVIGEPGGIRSPECAWRLSTQCFRISRGCCYTLLSIFVAPLFALCLGLSFACLAFEHIWCVAPCLRIWRINCFAIKNFWSPLVQTVVRPCTESCGYLFYNIRILNQKVPNTLERKDDLHVV